MNICANCTICKNLLSEKNINYDHGVPANYVALIQDIDPHSTVCKILDRFLVAARWVLPGCLVWWCREAESCRAAVGVKVVALWDFGKSGD